MKLSTKKSLALLATALLSTVGLTVASAPARAADCPYPVADPTSNDNPKTNIRLISPVLNDDNSVHRVGLETQFSMDCDWFGVGVRFNQVYVPHTMKTTLTFRATDAAGKPLANTKVKLRANKGYSGSNAKVKVNGVTARPAPSNASDGADIYGTTDLNGNVSFLVYLGDTDCSTYGGTLPPAPSSLSADTPHDLTNDATTDCYSQFLPEITGEKTDSADFVELHYFDASTLQATPGDKTVSILAPTLDDTNSISNDGFVQTYSPIGAKQIVAFQALNEDGSWARNVPVTVRINKSGSNSNAKISAGVFGNASNGASTTLTNSAAGELTLTATSDAFGIVTLQMNNTDTTGEVQPVKLNSAVPVSGAKFSRVSAEVDGETTTGDAAEFHYYKPIAVTIASSGKKINVTIANAVGRSTSISITGKSKVTVKPTKASQLYSYTVTSGAKTITVVSGLTTVTKKITIK